MNRHDAEQIVKSIGINADTESASVLKYSFGKGYREDMDAKELIALIKATNLSANNYNIDIAYIVATMCYAMKWNQGETKLQTVLSKVYHSKNTSASMKKSIEELLTSKDATSDRFVNTLKRVVTVAKSDLKEIDLISLCMDLSNWSEYAYRNWANEIIINRERED